MTDSLLINLNGPPTIRNDEQNPFNILLVHLYGMLVYLLTVKQVTVQHIPNNKYPLFMELAHSLSFVKKIEVEENPSKEKVLKGIKQAVKEVHLIKAGKLKARDARDLINEL